LLLRLCIWHARTLSQAVSPFFAVLSALLCAFAVHFDMADNVDIDEAFEALVEAERKVASRWLMPTSPLAPLLSFLPQITTPDFVGKDMASFVKSVQSARLSLYAALSELVEYAVDEAVLQAVAARISQCFGKDAPCSQICMHVPCLYSCCRSAGGRIKCCIK
jgi:hypothetical protein